VSVDTQTVVIGAGVVGLAVARALALSGREVVVLEAAESFGTEISSRNSEVIHAGIYYPRDSLKARLCVSGRRLLYAYCRDRNVEARPIGKLIVATSEAQTPALNAIAAAGRANGVDDLELWDQDQIRRSEPEIRGMVAIHSPSTGIIDSHGLMTAYLADLEFRGGVVAYRTPVVSVRAAGDHFVVRTGGDQGMSLSCREIVNAAGLSAVALARAMEGVPLAGLPNAHFAKGCYFQLAAARSPFKRLIYPIPEPGGLGVHATLDLGGQVRFGPDVEWVDAIDYVVDPARSGKFYAAVRDYWPGLADGALLPAYAGMRPKIASPDAPAADFHIASPISGLVNLLGIESPGLTASLAIAEHVTALLDSRAASQN
jgi:L-2-hydroxyglutarate oxidase LhgO